MLRYWLVGCAVARLASFGFNPRSALDSGLRQGRRSAPDFSLQFPKWGVRSIAIPSVAPPAFPGSACPNRWCRLSGIAAPHCVTLTPPRSTQPWTISWRSHGSLSTNFEAAVS